MEPVIRLSNVTRRFGRHVALQSVSLEVPPGVVFALLGENGAGKTTAIRILLGLLRPHSGKAEVLGFDSIRDGLEIRRRIGYVAERPTLYEWMTVSEIGWFTEGFYGGDFLKTYTQLCEQFGLPPKKKLKTLSKGARAKVALSLAMAHDPGLLVLDEPTSGLDTLVRREFLESMVDRAASGKTVLLSSHQIAEVERVADIVAIVREGKLVLVEKLETLKDEIREVTLTLEDPSLPLPAIAGQVLFEERKARQCRLLVRGEDAQVAALRGEAGIATIDIRMPSLEEIFVAFLQAPSASGGRGDSGVAPQSAAGVSL